MKELDVGIDLDGVCYDFDGALRHYLIEFEGWEPERLLRGGWDDPDTTWNFHEELWGLKHEDFLSACDRAVDSGVLFSHGEPYEESVESIHKLRALGHSIHLITSRAFGSKTPHNTTDWLNRVGIEYDSLIFTHKKGLVRPDIHLDDYEQNYYAMREHGVVVKMLDRPWNKHMDIPQDRVHTWEEFLDEVDRIAHG